MIKRTLGSLLAALVLTSGCVTTLPADQTAGSSVAQSAAPAASGETDPAVPQTDPSAPEPAASAAFRTSAPEPTAMPASQTPAPTPTATPTPAPVSDEALYSGALDSFFNDSVLIGDSMTAGFSHYILAQREKDGACLGNLKCIGQSGLFLKDAYQVEIGTRQPVLPYRGRYYSISDLVQTIGAKTLYLLLGVNDVYVYYNTVADDVFYFDEIIRSTREKSPEVQIVIISITPVLKSYAREYSNDPHYNIDVNEALCRYCEENGFGFVELAAHLRGEDGYLNHTYCSDDRFHLNQDGNALWLAALREYARTQYETGAWTPEETAD